MCNSSNSLPKETTKRPVLAWSNQENRVLDPKKSQNIAILLRALNVTKEEVCEALLDGEEFVLLLKIHFHCAFVCCFQGAEFVLVLKTQFYCAFMLAFRDLYVYIAPNGLYLPISLPFSD